MTEQRQDMPSDQGVDDRLKAVVLDWVDENRERFAVGLDGDVGELLMRLSAEGANTVEVSGGDIAHDAD